MGMFRTLWKVRKVVKVVKNFSKIVSMGARLGDLGSEIQQGARAGWQEEEPTELREGGSDLVVATATVVRIFRYAAKMFFQMVHGHDPFHEFSLAKAGAAAARAKEVSPEATSEPDAPEQQMNIFQLIPGGEGV
jgi:hypothetical protein